MFKKFLYNAGLIVLVGIVGFILIGRMNSTTPVGIAEIPQQASGIWLTEEASSIAGSTNNGGNRLLQSGYFTAGSTTYVNLVFSQNCPANVNAPSANWHYENADYAGATIAASHITSGNLHDDRTVEWKALEIKAAPSCNYAIANNAPAVQEPAIEGNRLLQSGYFTAGSTTYVNLVFSQNCPANVNAPSANWHYENADYAGATIAASHITSGNLHDDRTVEWKALEIPSAPSCNYALN
jgi:hypothetical protein